ncbi:MAG: hypothetical protein JSV64_00780 [Candidatus Bathyarchaeota archaeon]|nr:MAG: hypothetical protein JSV64_00780 [Candidatus Bathyarchaeota archaeon]
MLLMAAASVTISKLLDYDPVPYIFSATIMINLGGTSTLIGSPSNMIIGVASGISFTDFITYLTLCEVLLWVATISLLYYYFKPKLGRKKDLPEYNPWKSVENKRFFYQSILILALLVLLFFALDYLGIGPEAVAVGCAILALVLSNCDPSEIFKGIDWETVFFVAGFMFIIGGIQRTEMLDSLSTQLFQLFGGSATGATLATLWFSGVASAIVSNMAIALTFVPVALNFSSVNPNLRLPVTSALVLGTNLGGATTPLSGSVPMMAMGTLKREGISMNLSEFTKIGILTSAVQLLFASLYLILRFSLGG